MKILGLTGSIATGKSYVAEIFRQNNIIVFSSDKEVSNLLQDLIVIESVKNSEMLSPCVKDQQVCKNILSNIVFNNNNALNELEEILHPLVNKKREEFILNSKDEKFMLFEVPLLFEKGYQKFCDRIITTYCSEKTQKERALRRKNIDENR